MGFPSISIKVTTLTVRSTWKDKNENTSRRMCLLLNMQYIISIYMYICKSISCRVNVGGFKFIYKILKWREDNNMQLKLSFSWISFTYHDTGMLALIFITMKVSSRRRLNVHTACPQCVKKLEKFELKQNCPILI